MKRLDRERRTVAAMLRIYCRDHHAVSGGLCSECSALLEYAGARLARCPFGEAKSTCAKCPVHCYQPEHHKQIQVVMRHAGPRMPWHHPVLAITHLLDGLRKQPSQKL